MKDRKGQDGERRILGKGLDLPNAVQICHDMTRPPRTSVGAFSAENTGTVTSFNPIPMPSSIRVAASWPHVCETAIPKGATSEKIPPMKMTPRRPKISLRGSETQPALEGVWVSTDP